VHYTDVSFKPEFSITHEPTMSNNNTSAMTSKRPSSRPPSQHSGLKEPFEAVDLERNVTGASLNRIASGPPYTIFSPTTKMFILVSVSISSLISPFGATTFYPALDVLAAQLHVTPSMINLSLTTYMVSRSTTFPATSLFQALTGDIV